ncbi:hypothetical protein BpHYR1_007373 [Brachionus plicatilis]|uniref:Uncharacterized protein n=1 Tax=Brachionus plicatilis TaxID=10195 RepID=A0A3M7P313_BRAPC|nr:hypothetical protein BpHYR1_007373 [Brachionus plicatilis]
MGIKLISSMLSFIVSCLIIFGFLYCLLKYLLKRKNRNSNKNRSNTNQNTSNIVHVNYPNTGSPFYVQNSEIVDLPNRPEMSTRIESNVGWRAEVVPNAPPQIDNDQAPPPYSSVVNTTE